MTLKEKWLFECALADKYGKERFTFLHENIIYWSKKILGEWTKPKKV